MKVKDIIKEGVYDYFTQRSAAQKQAQSQQQDRNKASAAPALLTAALKKTTNWLQKKGPVPAPQEQEMVDQYRAQQQAPAIDWQTGNIKQEPESPSDFAKMFKIIDKDPVTIQWKQEVFQRKDGVGQWVNFPGGKPIPQAMIVALDKVSPPTATKPTSPATHGGINAISVKDNAGVVWTKDEDNNRWLNDAGTVADAAHVDQLEKRALTQYQARQMST